MNDGTTAEVPTKAILELGASQLRQAGGGVVLPYIEQDNLSAGSDTAERASSHRRILPIRIMKR